MAAWMAAAGAPAHAACLVEGSAPRLPATASWIAVPPEALVSARLAAGQLVLVGISTQSAPSPAAGGASPSSSSSAFGPAQDLMRVACGRGGTGPPELHDLFELCSARYDLPGVSRSSLAPGPGSCLMAARAWPAPKLPRGSVLLSPSLLETAGQPEAGTIVLLYRAPAAAAAAAAAGAGGASAGPAVAAAAHCPREVVLRLCADVLLQAPVTVDLLLPPAVTADGRSSSNSTPAATSSRGARGVGAPAPPQPAARGQSQAGGTPPSTPPPPGSGSRSGRSAQRGTPSGAGGGGTPGAVAEGPPPPQQQQQSSWPLRTLAAAAAAGDASTRAALEVVAGRHLAGRPLLLGSPVILPVLGTCVLACVVSWGGGGSDSDSDSNTSSTASNARHIQHHGSAGSAAGDAGHSPAPAALAASAAATGLLSKDLGIAELRPSTRIRILYPSEHLDPGSDAAAAATAPGSATAQAQQQQQRSTAVARAREAAAAAVSEGAAGAAADAAEAALRAGYASGGVDLSDLGGVGDHLRALRELVGLPLRAPHLFQRFRIRPPRGVLLYGPPGSGKTVLARAAAADAGATVFVINGPDIVSEYVGESEACLRGIFAAASALAPSLVFIDEVDALAPARSSGGGMGAHQASSDMSSRLVTALLTLLDGADEGPEEASPAPTSASASSATSPPPGPRGPPRGPVVVVAATNRPAALDPALRRPGRLERELEVGVPGPAARLEILRARLRAVRHSLAEEELASLAGAAHGFVSADLAALVDEAAMCALRRVVAAAAAAAAAACPAMVPAGQPAAGTGAGTVGMAGGGGSEAVPEGGPARMVVTLEDFRAAETRVRPSALREVAVEIPSVRWEDVGGLEDVKQALREAVEWPHTAPSAMARLGAQPPRGVLLYGPPGCSKTLLARAVAAEARLNFLSVKGGELYSKYVGESEKAVAAVFARARATAPSIIFFDEIDGLAGTRSGMGGGGNGGSSSVGERVITQLLTEMDGLQALVGVTVLAATNRPDLVDPALLRPGRFDRLLFVPPPDAAGRAEVLRVQLRRCPLAGDVDVGRLAARTEGFTGADLGALAREAALAALEESMDAQQVCARHFEAALGSVPPSAPPSQELLAMYQRMRRAAVA